MTLTTTFIGLFCLLAGLLVGFLAGAELRKQRVLAYIEQLQEEG